MAKRGGYIKLFRSLSASAMWVKEPFTRGQAWVDLLMLANYADGHIRVRGNRIDVARGQVGWSAERLAIRWMWSRGKVVRFLKELENEQQIEQQKSFVSSVLTLTNYERYQQRGTAERSTNGQQTDSRRTADDTADGHQSSALKKKNLKKKKEEEVGGSRAFIRPTLAEVEAYCADRNKGVNPQKWFDHYESNGWKVGKNSMKNWKAAVRKWEHGDYAAPASKATGQTWLEKQKAIVAAKEKPNGQP